jgi:hypothetical protein
VRIPIGDASKKQTKEGEMISLLTAVVTGVLVFVASQYILKLVLEPAVNLRIAIGKSINHLTVHHFVFTIPTAHQKKIEEATDGLKKLAGSLFEAVLAIPIYRHVRHILALPPQNDLFEAAAKMDSIAGTTLSGADWTLEENSLLSIQVLKLLRAPIPERMQGTSEARLEEIIGQKKRR